MTEKENRSDLLKRIQELEQRERVLREELERQRNQLPYRAIFEKAPVGIFQTTSSGQVLYINPYLARMVGAASPQEAMAYYTDLSRQLYADPARREALIRKLNRTGEVRGFEYEAIRLDGVKRWFSMNARISERTDDGQFVLYGFTNDITEVKLMQQALHASEERHRLLAENTLDAIWQMDLCLHFTYVNPSIDMLLGYRPEEFIGTALPEHCSEEDMQQMSAIIMRELENPRKDAGVLFETRLRHKEGYDIPVEIHGKMLFDEDGNLVGLHGTTRDIRERRQQQSMLEQSEARFRRAFENSAIGRTLTLPDGRLNRVNKALCVMLGYDEKTLAEKTIADITHPEDLAASQEMVKALLEGRMLSGRIEKRFLRADGSVLWADVSSILLRDGDGHPLHFITDLYDITERKSTEAALLKSERILRETQRISKVGGWEYRVDERKVYWTDGMYRIYEADNTSFDPNSAWQWLSIYGPDDQKMLRKVFRRLITDGRSYDLELPFTSVQGRPGWLRATGTAELKDGRPVRLFGNMMDISAQKQSEKKRKELEEQLHQSQKMEAVGRLAGGVAHDFNNLLSIILGYAEMALEDLPGGHPLHGSLKEVYDAAIRAKNLTRQLLAFSRKQVLEMHRTDLNRIVEGFEKLIRRVIGEDIELTLHLAPTPLLVKADVSQMEQVLMNLAVNSRDAMPQGGALTISTVFEQVDESHAIKEPDIAPDRYAVMSVEDTGMGMDRDTLNRIFEPFFTTKGKEQGTGLGLATTYGIVKQHGGSIRVTSEPGKGTQAKIYLPIRTHEAAREEKREKIEPQAEPVKGKATILVVEDDPAVRKLACGILRNRGYRIYESTNVKEAIHLSEKYAGQIELLLTDVVMPVLKGPEVYEKIAAHHPNMKVLYMSGYTDNIIAKHGVLEEGTQFIQKPFSVAALVNKVHQILNMD